jgi:hypothetical protein
MVKRSTCNCFCFMWKPTSHTMATKVLQTTWVLICSLPWVQRTRWISIGLVGSVHTLGEDTHRGRLTIGGCGNLNRV